MIGVDSVSLILSRNFYLTLLFFNQHFNASYTVVLSWKKTIYRFNNIWL